MHRLVAATAVAASLACVRCSLLVSSDGLADRVTSATVLEAGADTNDASVRDGGDRDAADAPAGPCDAARTSSDPKNCGRCGHDCLGGSCVSGKCAPFVVATGLTSPGSVALDAAHVYWARWGPPPGRIERVLRTGGAVEPVSAAQSGRTVDLVVEDTFVFFTSDPGIKKIRKDLTGAEISVFPYVASALAVDATRLFATVPAVTAGSAWRVERDGTNAVLFQSALHSPAGIALRGTDLIYGESDGPTLWRVDTNSAPNSNAYVALAAAKARRVRADDAFAYWTEYDSRSVFRVAVDGGTKTTVGTASGAAGVSDLALDATHAYWGVSTDSGSVVRAPKQGGAVETLASKVEHVAGIAVDDRLICWSEELLGKISCLAK